VVSVSVHDTGIGIPEDRLEDIFAPFAQVCVCGGGGFYMLACELDRFMSLSALCLHKILCLGLLVCFCFPFSFVLLH
jgi:hypothetical protein